MMKNLPIEIHERWKAALQRAALEGACSVEFSKSTDAASNSVSYSLVSYDHKLNRMPDARDYDLLKAVMVPLEKLSEDRSENAFTVTLNLDSGRLELESNNKQF